MTQIDNLGEPSVSTVLKALKDIKDVFIVACRRYGGRVENSTCYVPLRNLYYVLDEFGKEVEREGLYRYGAPLLKFVGEEAEPRRHRIVNIQLIPRGEKAEARVWLSSHVYDRLYKNFKKEEEGDEGGYYIQLENEFTLSAQGRTETPWHELGDAVNSLISDLSIRTTRVADVEDEAWRWFKKKVEDSHSWWELTRG